jgi:DNA-binding XRE family transcriptional regulator
MTPEQLRKLRERLGLSQVQLAKFLRVRSQTVCRWESGNRRVPDWLEVVFQEQGQEQGVTHPPGNFALATHRTDSE